MRTADNARFLEGRAFAQDVLLAADLAQINWPHPGGERGIRAWPFIRRRSMFVGVKKLVTHR